MAKNCFFGVYPQVVDHGKLIGTIFRHLRLAKMAEMAIYGHSNGQIGNYGSEHARNVFLVSIPRLLGMGN